MPIPQEIQENLILLELRKHFVSIKEQHGSKAKILRERQKQPWQPSSSNPSVRMGKQGPGKAPSRSQVSIGGSRALTPSLHTASLLGPVSNRLCFSERFQVHNETEQKFPCPPAPTNFQSPSYARLICYNQWEISLKSHISLHWLPCPLAITSHLLA